MSPSGYITIWRVFHLWLRFITFAGGSAHLAYCVHKSGCKTSMIIISFFFWLLTKIIQNKVVVYRKKLYLACFNFSIVSTYTWYWIYGRHSLEENGLFYTTHLKRNMVLQPDMRSIPFCRFQFHSIPFGQFHFHIKFINSNAIPVPNLSIPIDRFDYPWRHHAAEFHTTVSG